MKDLLFIVESIVNKGAILYLQKENLTFSKSESNLMNNFLLGLLSSFAEFERETIRFRQKIGIQKCKKKRL